jgi:hypothetical protein
LYTYEHVVPRMERALAEVHAGIEHDPRPLPSDCSGPPVPTDFVSPRTAGNAPLPVVGQAKAHPLPNLSSEVD